MKKLSVYLCGLGLFLLAHPTRLAAQEFEIQQLLLNVEKLAQLKSILQKMYDGYEIVSKGYNTIKNISEGNFSIHDLFLQNLLGVSPAVQKYKRVADIIQYQIRIVKEYEAAYKHFKDDKNFTTAEIEYMSRVYKNLFDRSVDNLDDLLMVITAGKLRMSDHERIRAIDSIFEDIEDQLGFLRHFNSIAYLMSKQRAKEKSEVEMSRIISGIK
ncbi:TerB family tellurite resistance protein [Longitalea arenae]|uniref:TerB family tellurite resistance protein n=1 Tax=Longitalea arenae TaxID=2812558 RepID=UPI00196898F8|nr:TerB family tellurite resistance protein [Longitalea arenae]